MNRPTAVLDQLVDDSRRHLADLLLRRITTRVRAWYPNAAALRLAAADYDWEITAVLDAAATPVPAGSRDPADEDTPAWSEVAVDDLVDAIGEDLWRYAAVRLDVPTDETVLPLAAGQASQ
ncbi:hypothetical protein [Frankia sp. Cas4]|uniref:hypothetical protein n=1 Tax=Frankia sp. Cas4 TaxID=3073927 RepID=UPI002AD31E10|nr:hypothetical protein [Frankia sp. Cas4]